MAHARSSCRDHAGDHVTDATKVTKVTKAVIPAAGLGTRFLPATKATPKEMIPLVDKPGIQYVVEEAVAAGIEDILIVTGRSKKTVEDHFDRAPELEATLERGGKEEALAEVEIGRASCRERVCLLV